MTMRPAAKVSIALATYNGAKYLPEQLASFLAQTRLPDELIVGDDNSQDGTIALLEEFAGRAPFPVKVTVNRPGLGPAANFATAIGRCSGDVIFLSDQDDIWDSRKIERMTEFLAERPGILVAVHDAALIDGDGTPIGLTMGGQIAGSGEDPARGLVAGCCMAFDAHLARLYDPVPDSETHDAWLTSMADDLGVRAYLPEALISYRRHGANVSQSFMSATERATRWARTRERIERARAEPVVPSLDRAARTQASALAALEGNASWLAELVGQGRFNVAVARRQQELAAVRRRLDIHSAPRSARLRLLVGAALAGSYRERGGLLSLLRDLGGILGQSGGTHRERSGY